MKRGEIKAVLESLHVGLYQLESMCALNSSCAERSTLKRTKSCNLLGPAYNFDHPDWAIMYEEDQQDKMPMIINNPDFKWDKCKMDQMKGFNHRFHITDDKDNPLFYFQSEFLVDEFDDPVEENSYYPLHSPMRSVVSQLDVDKFVTETDGLFYCMEKWNPINHLFWTQWVRQEMNSNLDRHLVNEPGLKYRGDAQKYVQWEGNGDGAGTFAQDLVWYNHRVNIPGRIGAGESFYIAYIASRPDVLSIQDVFMAVGVFIQAGSVYSTMGITKSFRLKMSDTDYAESCMKKSGYDQEEINYWIETFENANQEMKGSAVKLQNYVAKTMQTIDKNTKGLLFRPNGLMRKIMKKALQPMHSIYTGSNIDVRNFNQMIYEGTANVRLSCMDELPLIRQFPDRIELPDGPSVRIPFWEPPSRFSHPDAWLNPHLPLVYIPISAFHDVEHTIELPRHPQRQPEPYDVWDMPSMVLHDI